MVAHFRLPTLLLFLVIALACFALLLVLSQSAVHGSLSSASFANQHHAALIAGGGNNQDGLLAKLLGL